MKGKFNKAYFIYIFILIHPILDLITSLYTRFTDYRITIGIIIKGLALLLLMIYLIFYSKSKYRKMSIYYLIFQTVFVVFYFVSKPAIFNFNILLSEVIIIFKYIYLPLMFIGFLNFIDEFSCEHKKIRKCFQINALIFSVLIIIPQLTNTSFNSYVVGNNNGVIGWYYSANEISAILTILFPFTFEKIYKGTWKSYIYIFPVVFAMSLIGTKTAFLGLIIPTIILLFYFIITIRKLRSKKIVITSVLLVTIIILSPNLSVIQNLKANIKKINNANDQVEENNSSQIGDLVFSTRDVYLKNINIIYLNSEIQEKLFGIGFETRDKNVRINKLIEMDPFDIFYRLGIIGFIVYFMPFIYGGWKVLKYLYKYRFKFNFYFLFELYSVLIAFAISLLAGHVLGAPSTSIYLALGMVILIHYYLSIMKENKVFDSE